MVQNFKIALITIGFIVNLLKTLVALKKAVSKKRFERLSSLPCQESTRNFCLWKAKTPLNQLECDSAIGLHLLQKPDCAAHYHDRQFSILAQARTQFHLAALEAIFIKTQQPILCGQKEFVYSLQILQ